MSEHCDAHREPCPREISRRDFLKLAAAGGLLVAGCQPERSGPSPGPAAQVSPTAVAPAPRARVAIAQAGRYERKLVRQQVQALFDGLGGLEDVVRSGDRVAIKVNLTGGTHFTPPSGLTATESYMTHPEVVRALGELLRDAGAGELIIVEAVYDEVSYAVFGYEEVAQALDARLVDLNDPHPYADFAPRTPGEGWLVYEELAMHPLLGEIDALVSVAKMKCHFDAGITLSMKNLMGLLPASRYRLDESHWWRSAVHGPGRESKTRLPRAILDLNRARPIDLALIDGIMTAEGGEAPRGSFRPVQPGVLIAGKNPVATDAVAAAAMGFDPTVEPPTPPFLRGDNYLNLARELGLGTHRLEEIDVVGAAIDDVIHEFKPSWEM
jgi:uncharacterized protein (DUF362 family)